VDVKYGVKNKIIEDIGMYRRKKKNEVLRNALKTFMSEEKTVWVREGTMSIIEFSFTNKQDEEQSY